MGWTVPDGVAHILRRGYLGSYPHNHPQLYRPIDLKAYVWFKYFDEGRELGNRTLEAFCGDSGAKHDGNCMEPRTAAG